MAGSNVCPNSLPGHGRGPYSEQLQSLSEGGCTQCLAARPETGTQGAMDILVG